MLSFSVSLFIIVTVFFINFYKKNGLKKFLFIFSILFFFELLPQALWKQNAFDYPFYNFLINPLPLNTPGFSESFANIKNYYNEKFPLIILMPLEFKDLTQFIGLGALCIFIILISSLQNKKTILFILIFFISIYTLFGQKAARFYTEIYFFVILIMTFVISKFKNFKLLNIYKLGINVQSILMN